MKRKIILILSLSLWIGSGCKSNQEKVTESEKIWVQTAPVVSQSVQIPVHTSGKLALAKEIKLAFKTGGIIQSIAAVEGAIVNSGTVLAKLDLSEIDAQVAQARSGMEKAQRDFYRVQRLYTDSVATFEQLQNASTYLNIARSQLTIAELNQKHSVIRAPARGKVLKQLAEVKEMIGPGTPIFLFGSLEGNWLVRVGVTDRDFLRLTVGDSATVSFDVYPAKLFSGQISQITGTANPMTGTFEIEVAIKPENYRLVSGLVAKVTLFPAQSETLALIPIEALVAADADSGFVFIPDAQGEIAQRLAIKIAYILENSVAVSAGLENIPAVITEGSSYLVDGTAIQIIRP